jgi:peptidoglycan/xylan/chitin deacetylase (PgdA/CDA1 family)
MRRITAISCVLASWLGAFPALAAECANPNALGTSRTLVIDTNAHPRLGAMQYLETLPLAPGEVVLTFDDGPLPPYTSRILDTLAAECVKATYFLVGQMAQHAPELVRRIRNEGHTIGTHSFSHPLTFDRMPLATAQREIDGGVAAVGAVLGDPAALAPFFRIPGLLRTHEVENYIASRSLVTWSVDLVADDWHRGISSTEVMQRALQRLEARGRGILLLHDIQPATVLALPGILKGLKARGFRIVHVVPAGPAMAATPSKPQQWASRRGSPRDTEEITASINPRLNVPSRESLGIDYAFGRKAIITMTPKSGEPVVMAAAGAMPRDSLWPQYERAVAAEDIASPQQGVENSDWPQTISLADVDVSQAAEWPTAAVLPEPELRRAELRPTISRNRPSRSARAKPSCRNPELIAVGLAPACKKPVGHQLSLNPREPAG